MVLCVTGLSHLASCLQGSFKSWHVSGRHSFLRLNNTPLCGRPTFCSFIHGWSVGSLPCLAVMSNAVGDICARALEWTYVFISPGCVHTEE